MRAAPARLQYDAAKRACDSRSGNAKDICMAEAKGKQKVAKLNGKAGKAAKAAKAKPIKTASARIKR